MHWFPWPISCTNQDSFRLSCSEIFRYSSNSCGMSFCFVLLSLCTWCCWPHQHQGQQEGEQIPGPRVSKRSRPEDKPDVRIYFLADLLLLEGPLIFPLSILWKSAFGHLDRPGRITGISSYRCPHGSWQLVLLSESVRPQLLVSKFSLGPMCPRSGSQWLRSPLASPCLAPMNDGGGWMFSSSCQKTPPLPPLGRWL